MAVAAFGLGPLDSARVRHSSGDPRRAAVQRAVVPVAGEIVDRRPAAFVEVVAGDEAAHPAYCARSPPARPRTKGRNLVLGKQLVEDHQVAHLPLEDGPWWALWLSDLAPSCKSSPLCIRSEKKKSASSPNCRTYMRCGLP